jgi:3,4-dihydroxy-2-butanone 4-phosphate synthase
MFILIDDSDRENEGDLIVSAHHVTSEQMTQMINYTSGIICLVINEDRRKLLNLDLQPRRGEKVNELYTAFLTSIEAADNISTGVCANDRVTTIKTAISDDEPNKNIVTPGHIFPLLANPGGLTVRRGHTEASVAIMKLAGLDEAAVLSEIMNKDGTMARLPELMKISKELNIKISSIELLIEYINNNEIQKNSIKPDHSMKIKESA